MSEFLAQRVAAVREGLSHQKLDGLVIQDRVSSLYLSGFPCSNSLILITRQHAWFFTDFRYIIKAKAAIPHLEVLQMPQNTLNEVAARAKKLKLRRIGFEEVVSFGQFTALKKALETNIDLIPAGDIVRSLRVIKSRDEVRQIASNQRLNEKIYSAALGAVTAESTEISIRNHILTQMIAENCEEAFASIIATGRNSAMPHAVAGTTRVKTGQFLLFDMGVKKRYYHSDMTRTIAVGKKLSARAAEIYDLVKLAQETALQLVGPGVACKAVDSAARKVISDAGYGDYFGHGLGHGVGLEIHEGPTLNTQSTAVLQPGMVITIEPGVYLPGVGGVRIEDLVLVTENGYKNMTSLSKELRHISLQT